MRKWHGLDYLMCTSSISAILSFWAAVEGYILFGSFASFWAIVFPNSSLKLISGWMLPKSSVLVWQFRFQNFVVFIRILYHCKSALSLSRSKLWKMYMPHCLYQEVFWLLRVYCLCFAVGRIPKHELCRCVDESAVWHGGTLTYLAALLVSKMVTSHSITQRPIWIQWSHFCPFPSNII